MGSCNYSPEGRRVLKKQGRKSWKSTMSRGQIICLKDDCGRKANNLCPNSLCLAHCHESIDTPGFIHCKRHEREWENKQKYPRKKDRADYGSKTSHAQHQRARQAQQEAVAQYQEDNDNPYEDKLLDKQRKRLRSVRGGRGTDRDAFFVLGAAAGLVDGTTILQRSCPKCGVNVPEVGSFFWLHLSQCDPVAFGHYAEGAKSLEPAVMAGGHTDADNSNKPAAVIAGGDQMKEVGDVVHARKERVTGILDEIMKANREELEEMIRDNHKTKTESLRELAMQADQMGKDLSGDANVNDPSQMEVGEIVKVETPQVWDKPLITKKDQLPRNHQFAQGPFLRL